MKDYLSILIAILLSATLFTSCGEEDDTEEYVGNWVERSSFAGFNRSGAVVFVIGTKAYVGTGYDGEDWLQDFWSYDDDSDWSEGGDIKDFPGVGRNGAVAFAANGKGYVGLGWDGETSTTLDDFYVYDPETNTWDSIAQFPGAARYDAVAFAIDDIGYVSCGYNRKNYMKDLYSYDPEKDTWSKRANFEGYKRQAAAAFVINGYGYVCTGINNGSYPDDFFRYNPSEDEWTRLHYISDHDDDESFDDDYSGIIGTYKASFTIDGKGFLATGGSGSTSSLVWEYDPATDLWERKTNYEATARTQAIGFSITDSDGIEHGYVGIGKASSTYKEDFYEFFPYQEYDDDDEDYVFE